MVFILQEPLDPVVLLCHPPINMIHLLADVVDVSAGTVNFLWRERENENET